MGWLIPLLFGLVLRLLSWRMQGTGWLDELFSLHFASLSLAESWPLVVQDWHPPIYHLLLTGWMRLWGGALWSARLLSVLLGSLAVPAVWLAGREVDGRRAAAAAACLVALSPAVMFHSGEARMYPLLLFLSALSLWLFLRAWRNGFGWRVLAVWGPVAGLTLLTHVTAALPFLISVLWGWRQASRSGRRRLSAVATLSSLPFLFWLVGILALRSGGMGGAWQLNLVSGLADYVAVLPKLLAYGASWPWLLVEGAMLTSLAGLSLRRGGPKIRLLLGLVGIPFLAYLPLGWTAIKYHFVLLPALVVLLAVGWRRLSGLAGSRQRLLLTVLAILQVTILLPALWRLVSVPRVRWDEAMDFIESRERSGDLVFAEWFVSELPIGEYYGGSLPVASGYAYEESLSFDERLVRYSGSAVATPEMLARMAQETVSFERVFLVTGAFRPDGNPVQAWFVGHGWRLEGSWSANQFSPTILLFDSPK